MTRYVSVADVLAIHADLIANYGGGEGIRDFALLEAAIFRPQSGYYRDILAEAAALWESLSQNHPFVDGNKRVGFAATYTFLAINGYEIIAGAEATFEFIDGLYANDRFRADVLDPWLRKNVISRNHNM